MDFVRRINRHPESVEKTYVQLLGAPLVLQVNNGHLLGTTFQLRATLLSKLNVSQNLVVALSEMDGSVCRLQSGVRDKTSAAA